MLLDKLKKKGAAKMTSAATTLGDAVTAAAKKADELKRSLQNPGSIIFDVGAEVFYAYIVDENCVKIERTRDGLYEVLIEEGVETVKIKNDEVVRAI